MLNDHPTIALDPIPGHPDYLACRLGAIFSAKTGRPIPLNPWMSGKYLQVSMHHDGNRYVSRVHQLILETYVGPRPDGMECRHLNSVTTDNRLSNLAWGTTSENGEDRKRAGSLRGINHPGVRLTEDDIRAIRTMTTRQAVERYGISRGYACEIRRRVTWRHVD
jgi:hypothetical protein